MIAVKCCDNDFHSDLRKACNHIVVEYDGYYQQHIGNLKQAIINLLVVMATSKSVLRQYSTDPQRIRAYLESTIVVSKINTTDELDSSFEGYILTGGQITFKSY